MIAGSIGVDPTGYTLRELLWMREGKDRHAWSVASEIIAVMANLWGKKGKRFCGRDFNPYRDAEANAAPVPLEVLRRVFVERKPV